MRQSSRAGTRSRRKDCCGRATPGNDFPATIALAPHSRLRILRLTGAGSAEIALQFLGQGKARTLQMDVAGEQLSLLLLVLLGGRYDPQSIRAKCNEFPTRMRFFADRVVRSRRSSLLALRRRPFLVLLRKRGSVIDWRGRASGHRRGQCGRCKPHRNFHPEALCQPPWRVHGRLHLTREALRPESPASFPGARPSPDLDRSWEPMMGETVQL